MNLKLIIKFSLEFLNNFVWLVTHTSPNIKLLSFMYISLKEIFVLLSIYIHKYSFVLITQIFFMLA